MADTTFVDKTTVVATAWLNDANKRVYQDFINVGNAPYSITPSATTDWTTTFATAIAAAIAGNKAIFIPPGTYLATLSVRGSNVAIFGAGSAVTTIKHPVKTISNVLELGDTASGNAATAYSGIVVSGLTLDGNRSNVTQGSDDFTGHGLPMTKISKFHLSDVRAINCWNAGVGVFIDSNYGYADVYVENCGNATAGQTTPGFDINSSKYGQFTAVSKDCYAGGRVLDNCYGNSVRISVQNATKDGFNYNNQSSNYSYANNLDITVYTCGQHGLNIGENCFGSNIKATIYSATNSGCVIGDATAHPSYGNIIDLATYSSGDSGLLIKSDGNDNIIRHQSNLDGRTGAQGTAFAVDVSGNRNNLSVSHIDSATWQVRGVAFRAGAADNILAALTFNTTQDPINDAGTRTQMPGFVSPFTASKLKYFTIPVGDVAYGSIGTNTVPVAGTIYWAEVYLDCMKSITGIGVLNGGTVGTNKYVLALYDNKGALLANTALAGVLTSGANAFQEIAFTAISTFVKPGRYWIAVQMNGVTDRFRSIAVSTFLNVRTTSAAGAFGTLTALSVPSTFTADVGPVAYVY